MTTDNNTKSLVTLFSDLTRETINLVRQEIALGRAEVSQKISSAQTGVTAIAIGAAVVLAGLFIILQAVVNALMMVLPPEIAPWLAPLIVGAVVAGIGYFMLKAGSTKLKPDNLIPHRTVDSFMRNKLVIKEKMQ